MDIRHTDHVVVRLDIFAFAIILVGMTLGFASRTTHVKFDQAVL